MVSKAVFWAPSGVMISCVCVRDIMLRMALKEFLQHSEESRGGSSLGQASMQVSKHAGKQVGKHAGKHVS